MVTVKQLIKDKQNVTKLRTKERQKQQTTKNIIIRN